MPWILIVLGVFLMIIGGYLKYQQFGPEYSENYSVEEKLEDEYIKRTNKYKKINNELNQLIKSIDLKEKMITKKINSITNLESIVEEVPPHFSEQNNNRLYKVTGENDFKKVFERKYQEREQAKSGTGNFNDRLNSKYNDVLTLAWQGLGAELIAERLDIGVRETKLILKLYKKEEDSIV